MLLTLLRFGFVAPVFAHFNETIASLTTVRAFQQQQRLIEKNDKNNDNFGRAMLSQNLCFRWLSIRLNSVCKKRVLIFCGASLY